MKVSIETNETKIVIEDEFNSADAEKRHDHNTRLISMAYQYVVNKELMLQYEGGELVKVVAK